jgi:hypothetical protein
MYVPEALATVPSICYPIEDGKAILYIRSENGNVPSVQLLRNFISLRCFY